MLLYAPFYLCLARDRQVLGSTGPILGASLAMEIILCPLLLAIAVVVRIVLGSPVLFRQLGPGYTRSFTCLKFRTTTDKRDAKGQLFSDAERLTQLGRSLRSTSVDELRERINVIRGEMSLVGPRPLLMQYLERYTLEQMRRHDVRPGVTGLGTDQWAKPGKLGAKIRV